jgi:hypothetical protein
VSPEGEISLATKMAKIEVGDENTPFLPLRGNEPWTTDDNRWWNVVGVEMNPGVRDSAVSSTDTEATKRREVYNDFDESSLGDTNALYRRHSLQPPLCPDDENLTVWLGLA